MIITKTQYFAKADKDEDYEESPWSLNSRNASNIYDVLANLHKRRDNINKGGINCIPFVGLNTFNKYLPGVEQEQFVVITASTKIGKTQISTYLYIYNVLEYCFTHQDQCSCHIIYIPLEESTSRITERYMSHLLWQLDGRTCAPHQQRSLCRKMYSNFWKPSPIKTDLSFLTNALNLTLRIIILQEYGTDV